MLIGSYFRTLSFLIVISSMNLTKKRDLRARTFDFSARVLHTCASLSQGSEIGVIKRQLIRAATSVGANYRAAGRGKSRRDFISKLSIVEEEADECIYWLSLLESMGCKGIEVDWLKKEANEIVSIIVASKKTAKRNLE
jgi:four helix bundle protein